MEIDLEPEDIDISHRMGKGSRTPRPIIVRFTNYYSRDKLYKNRRKLRRVNIGRFIEGAENVYINENLTAFKAGLFKKVRDKKRLNNEWKVWSLDEKIFVKTYPESNSATLIKTEEDLEKL